jgi:hypothetical protein
MDMKPPLDPDELSKDDLAEIVRTIQARLFLDEDSEPPHREIWTLDKSQDLPYLAQSLVDLMDNFNLLPRKVGPKDWKPKNRRP